MRHRPFIVLLSALADLIVIGAIVVASGLAPGGLPVPHQLLAAPVERRVQLPDIPLPAKPRTPAPPAPSHDAAPVEPPESVTPESPNPPAGNRSVNAEPGFGGEPAARDPGDFSGNGLTPVEPPPAPVTNTPVRLHSGIEAPRKLRDVTPVYPASARAQRVQGLVILEVTIDEHGSVANAHVLRSQPGLDQAALDAVTQWTFAPARLNGEAIPVVMTVTVNFRLAP